MEENTILTGQPAEYVRLKDLETQERRQMEKELASRLQRLFMTGVTERYAYLVNNGFNPELAARIDLTGAPRLAAEETVQFVCSYGFTPFQEEQIVQAIRSAPMPEGIPDVSQPIVK